VNSRRNYDDSELKGKYRVATVDASMIAVRHHLGSPSAPIVNTAILGAFAKSTGLVSLDSIEKTIEEFVPTNQSDNVAATKAAFNLVKF
jgi:Pyruvate/2-oxoacid:ferredoxin oxidoreductase gamma subunit